ncbi:MAG: hypothetical protein ACTSQJ_04825 [Promethearchaeota archaeon]
MPDSNDDKSKFGVLELVACSRCGNPFMRDKKQKADAELVCENCIKLEQRKRELQISVMENIVEVENKMEDSVNEMKDQLKITRGKFNKQFFLEKIKRRAYALTKSIELIEKIEETNNEDYIEEYKKLFNRMKSEYD